MLLMFITRQVFFTNFFYINKESYKIIPGIDPQYTLIYHIISDYLFDWSQILNVHWAHLKRCRNPPSLPYMPISKYPWKFSIYFCTQFIALQVKSYMCCEQRLSVKSCSSGLFFFFKSRKHEKITLCKITSHISPILMVLSASASTDIR